MKQTFLLTAGMICLLLFSCKKQENGSGISLPLTIDFTDKASFDNATNKGLVFKKFYQEWRVDNCSKQDGQEIVTEISNMYVTTKYYTYSRSSIVCNISKIKNLRKVTVHINVEPAYDDVTLQKIKDATVTLCNSNGKLAQIDTPAVWNWNTNVYNSISGDWVLPVEGLNGENLTISSDQASVSKITFE